MRILVLAAMLLVAMPCSSQSDDYFKHYIQYLDHLKTCSPYKMSYRLRDDSGIMAIKGKVGTKCHVVTTRNASHGVSDCLFTPKSRKLFHSDAKYALARSHRLETDQSEAERSALLDECEISDR
jgi:hypothetical protein